MTAPSGSEGTLEVSFGVLLLSYQGRVWDEKLVPHTYSSALCQFRKIGLNFLAYLKITMHHTEKSADWWGRQQEAHKRASSLTEVLHLLTPASLGLDASQGLLTSRFMTKPSYLDPFSSRPGKASPCSQIQQDSIKNMPLAIRRRVRTSVEAPARTFTHWEDNV